MKWAQTSIQQTWMPSLTKKEALSYCTSVVNRAKATQISKGEQEHRYKYRRQTLWEQFEPLIPDDLLPSMRAIIPDDLAQQREAERQGQRCRVSEGRYQRKTATKGDAANQKRTVRRLLSQGLPKTHIADRLGISKQRLNTIIKNMTKK